MTGKRKRQRENRRARAEAELRIPAITDADLDSLLVDVAVRADCEHASTRETADSVVLLRCAKAVSVAGSCPRDCASFEPRRVGGIGIGFGAG
jgi:hypothetical protein